MRDLDARVRFWSKVGGLISGGVPWVDAFALAASAIEDAPAFRAALDRVVDRMRAGGAPSDAMSDEDAFSDEVVRTVRAGEDTGDLEVKCLHVATQLETGTFEAGRRASDAGTADPRLLALVEQALDRGATHLHLEPTGGGAGRARIRIDGSLGEPDDIPADEYGSLLADLLADPTPGRTLTMEIGGRARQLTADVAPYAEGPGAVIGLTERPTADRVHVRQEDAERILGDGTGFVLVAGPPDVGLATVVRVLAPDGGKTCVLADDELPVPGALRLPTGEADAAAGQDPDLLVLPRVPDAAAARLAVRLARRGVRVVAAVDADLAASALAAFLARGADPASVAATTTRVLVPRVLPRDRRAGGILALGVLEIGEDLRRTLRLESDPRSIERVARAADQITVREAATSLAKAGEIDLDKSVRFL